MQLQNNLTWTTLTTLTKIKNSFRAVLHSLSNINLHDQQYPILEKKNKYCNLNGTALIWLEFNLNEGWKSRDAVPELVEQYLSNKLMVDELITHNLPIESINEAFALMKNGRWFV